MITTVSAPVWAPWTSYYDSAGQGPDMVTKVAGGGLSVQFLLDRFTLSVQGDQDAPFAGAAGLSGALSVDVPPDFNLLGFLLVVNGHVEKTVKSQATVTCSIGHGTQSQSWQLGIPAGDGDLVTGSDFSLECFTSDYNPATVGVPPYPPLPPFPVTVSMQARRRTADEAIDISVTDFTVILIGS
ncbi:MAG TPA: hypothetical protein VGI00_11985 [Streptosporangiaceae bacterium]|jgi:hypothetical protein